MTTGNNIHV